MHYLARTELDSNQKERLWKEVLLLAINKNADVTVSNNHGVTPLHDACFSGSEVKAKILLRAGASISATTRYHPPF